MGAIKRPRLDQALGEHESAGARLYQPTRLRDFPGRVDLAEFGIDARVVTIVASDPHSSVQARSLLRVVSGRDDGRFRAIQIQVDGSALELFEIKVTFGDGQTFEPKTRLVFDKSSRSRNIDLPGDKRVIKKVEFRYGNLPGGGRARVELWGQSA